MGCKLYFICSTCKAYNSTKNKDFSGTRNATDMQEDFITTGFFFPRIYSIFFRAFFKMYLSPLDILKANSTNERAENARLSSFIGAAAIGDLIKSTLGPKGMDKILQSLGHNKDVTVTNDGATIMKNVVLDNPAAKVLANVSKIQDDEIGDGTTSVCVLAAELLKEGEKLVNMKIHPQIIIQGYRIATDLAIKALEESAEDHSATPELFRKDLLSIARTTLSSKVLANDKEHFAEMAVNAVLRLGENPNLDHIHTIKKPGGNISDSILDEGFILDKKVGINQPKRLENLKILIANTSMDTDKIKIFGARVETDSTAKLSEIERAEREKMRAKVEKIKKHGINCFINRQLIYNWPEQLFTDNGIVSIEHADFEGIERLALVTGGEIASTFNHPELVKLGKCDLMEEIMIGEDALIKFSGVADGKACTVVLRGSTNHILDEAERSFHDAVSAVSQMIKDPRVVYGGGCSETIMANAIDASKRIPGKCYLAVEAFARALMQIPSILAENAGFDSADMVAKLRAMCNEKNGRYGIDMEAGTIGDMKKIGIMESFRAKKHMIISASEACEMILRVDDIIKCAPRSRKRE